MTSLLSFYGPEKKLAFFFNIQGLRKNQFSYWPSMMERQTGKTGFFVMIVTGKGAMRKAMMADAVRKAVLAKYFHEIATPLIIIPLAEENNEVVKVAVVIRAEGYKGMMPATPEKY